MEKEVNFADRLSDLIKEDGKSLREIAKECKMSYSSLSKYQNDSQTPDANSLQSIADYFKVTTDYLLCRTDVRKPDATMQAVNKMTRLRERAINVLITDSLQVEKGHKVETSFLVESLSDIIESNHFAALMQAIRDLKALSPAQIQSIFEQSKNHATVESWAHGSSISANYQTPDEVVTFKRYHVSQILYRILDEIEKRYWREEK